MVPVLEYQGVPGISLHARSAVAARAGRSNVEMAHIGRILPGLNHRESGHAVCSNLSGTAFQVG